MNRAKKRTPDESTQAATTKMFKQLIVMKRFASHYLLVPAVGYMKQQVVEITDEGVVRGVFPLTEEIESVEWVPGMIVLFSENQMEEIKNTGMILKNIPVFQVSLPSISNQSSQCFNEYLQEAEEKGEALLPYLFYPFDLTSTRPVDGTRHRLLW